MGPSSEDNSANQLLVGREEEMPRTDSFLIGSCPCTPRGRRGGGTFVLVFQTLEKAKCQADLDFSIGWCSWLLCFISSVSEAMSGSFSVRPEAVATQHKASAV